MASNKWSLDLLEDFLKELGIDYVPIRNELKSLVLKTMISIHTQNVEGVRGYFLNKASCDELFGFDVLLDKNLKPWLMEVNISPSMKASCPLDFKFKSDLAVDLCNCVGFRLQDIELASKIKKKYTCLIQYRTVVEKAIPFSG
jgi:tubulin polyglutamylase TTLL4